MKTVAAGGGSQMFGALKPPSRAEREILYEARNVMAVMAGRHGGCVRFVLASKAPVAPLPVDTGIMESPKMNGDVYEVFLDPVSRFEGERPWERHILLHKIHKNGEPFVIAHLASLRVFEKEEGEA